MSSTNSKLYGTLLNPQFHEIRILILKAGKHTDELTCNLSIVSLDNVPYYEALSYVWGAATDPRIVLVNNTPVAVTRNLEIALRHLRDPKLDRVLWIDAVCINQQDVKERNSQVAFMGDIYRSAENVLIWLGEADDESDLAFELMPHVDINFIESRDASKLWSFFLSAVQRPYMSRVWVIQEFVLAKNDPVVLCGHKQVLWSAFIAAYKMLALEFFTEIDMVKSEAADRPPTVLGKLRFDLLDEVRNTITEDGGADMRQLFVMSRTSRSTEPRDRIYGLLQMLEEDDKKQLTVDYNKPVAIVYAEAMALIFRQGDGPFFLSGMWCPSKVNPEIPNLPSWVPDFTSQEASLIDPLPSPISLWPAFPRTVSGAGAGADNGVVLDDLKTLKVEALPVDVIEDVLIFDRKLEDCLQQLAEVEARANTAKTRPISDTKLRPYFEKFRSTEPLWRTLVSSKKHGTGYDVAPDAYEVTYQEIRSALSSKSWQESLVSSEYYRALESHLLNRTFFTTRNGLIGLGMPGVQKGDEITIWFGAAVAFVIRISPQDSTKFSFIGAAYVAGIMEGEMVDELYCEDLLDSKTLLVI